MNVDPRENSVVNGGKVKAGNGRKVASVDPRENSGANRGKKGERRILRGGELIDRSEWGEGVPQDGESIETKERKKRGETHRRVRRRKDGVMRGTNGAKEEVARSMGRLRAGERRER